MSQPQNIKQLCRIADQKSNQKSGQCPGKNPVRVSCLLLTLCLVLRPVFSTMTHACLLYR